MARTLCFGKVSLAILSILRIGGLKTLDGTFREGMGCLWHVMLKNLWFGRYFWDVFCFVSWGKLAFLLLRLFLYFSARKFGARLVSRSWWLLADLIPMPPSCRCPRIRWSFGANASIWWRQEINMISLEGCFGITLGHVLPMGVFLVLTTIISKVF